MNSPALRRAVALASLALALTACSSGPATPTDAATDTGVARDAAGPFDAPTSDGTAICPSSAVCDDGVYCNGPEQCAPGAAGANAGGCVHGTPPCTMSQMCIEATRTCTPLTCTHMATPDMDGDGHAGIACGGDDCDDTDPHRYPGNPEVCLVGTAADGTLTRTGAAMVAGVAMALDPTHDEDCDPTTFASATTHDGDHDGDGYVDVACSNTDRSGMTNHGSDCQDLLAQNGFAGTPSMTTVQPGNIHPMQSEVCNGVDDNCNMMVDEDVTPTFYPDCDGDMYGDATAAGTSACFPSQTTACMGHASVTDHTDCNDRVANVHPSAPELCDAAMVDENCNGATNEGCACTIGMTMPCGSTAYQCMHGVQSCVMDTTGSSWGACPVTNTYLNCYQDTDGDGYAPLGATATVVCASCPTAMTLNAPTPTHFDCNDMNRNVNSGAVEVCNLADNSADVDEDCNPSTLAGPPDADLDGDGYVSALCCNPNATGTLVCGSDCDDGLASVHPGAAEICDGLDQNCNRLRDEGLTGCTPGNPRVNTVPCPAACSTTSSVCCEAGGLPETCRAGVSTVCGTYGYAFHCDGPEDCSGGSICCLVDHSASGGLSTAACAAPSACVGSPSTGVAAYTLCQDDVDCPVGENCVHLGGWPGGVCE